MDFTLIVLEKANKQIEQIKPTERELKQTLSPVFKKIDKLYNIYSPPFNHPQTSSPSFSKQKKNGGESNE